MRSARSFHTACCAGMTTAEEVTRQTRRSKPFRLRGQAGMGRRLGGADQLLDGAHDLVETAVGGGGEALADDMVDQGQEGLPVAGQVGEQYRLVVQAQLAPG